MNDPTNTASMKGATARADDFEIADVETLVASTPMPRQVGLVRERRRLATYAMMMVVDVSMLLIGALLAARIYLPEAHRLEQAMLTSVLVVPLFVAIALNSQAYSLRALTSLNFSLRQAMLSLAAAFAAVIFFAFFMKASEEFSRFAFALNGIISAVLILAARRIGFPMARMWCGHSGLSVIVVLDGGEAPLIPHASYVDAASTRLRPDIRDPLALDRIGRFLGGADRVVVACAPERRHAWSMVLKGAAIAGEIVEPSIADLGVLGTRNNDGTSTVVVSAGALGLRNRLIKRALDFPLALVACIALLPLLAIVALLIKLEDRGPVLFKQQRLGRGNQLFDIYKFRSMRVQQCDANGNVSASRDDDRITRIGRFIRGTSIDELPQLFNILKGDMSFVGPRPHALGSLAGTKLFWEVDPRYWHRHALKPGLTGLAQIRGFRGATHREDDLTQRLQADLEYLNGWNILRDVAILFATLRVVVHRNAF